VEKGREVGSVIYYLDEEEVKIYPIIVTETIREKDMKWYFRKIVEIYFIGR